QGGEVYLNLPDAEVTCLPQDLPDFIEVDIANMEVGQVLHMSDLKLPQGVAFVALQHGSDLPEIGRASCRERVWIAVVVGSSRRRHTRFSRDWSSDVCSSDLAGWRSLPEPARR